jgi:hypothetical protein
MIHTDTIFFEQAMDAALKTLVERYRAIFMTGAPPTKTKASAWYSLSFTASQVPDSHHSIFFATMSCVI